MKNENVFPFFLIGTKLSALETWNKFFVGSRRKSTNLCPHKLCTSILTDQFETGIIQKPFPTSLLQSQFIPSTQH